MTENDKIPDEEGKPDAEKQECVHQDELADTQEAQKNNLGRCQHVGDGTHVLEAADRSNGADR